MYRDADADWTPVALIDWDMAAARERIHDVAHVCWQYVGLGPTLRDVESAGRQVRLIADGYRLDDRSRLVDTILWWQDRCWRGIEAEAAAGRPHAQALRAAGAVEEVHAAFTWTLAQRSHIARHLD